MSTEDTPLKDEEEDLEAEFHHYITTLQTLTNQPTLSTLHSSTLCLSAYTTASRALPRPIFNHVLRVFYYAIYRTSTSTSASTESPSPSSYLSPSHLPLLFTASILHDLGASPLPQYNRSHQRFEIDGADAASELLAGHGASAAARHDVWVAIALHATPGIAERIAPLARLVREAVRWDFGVLEGVEGEGEEEATMREIKAGIENELPRLEAEKVLGDAVVRQAVERPGKAPKATWPGCLLEAYRRDPGWKGVNPAF